MLDASAMVDDGSVQFDVAVVGAGPAGAATARWLAQRGCRVVLIERTRFASPRIGESLAPAVQPLLAELGVWSDFLSLSPLPSHGTRSVWGETTTREHSHLMSPWRCGWHVDRSAFDRMLAEAARAAGAALLCGTTVVACRAIGAGWFLTLVERDDEASERTTLRLRARVLVDATGRPARLGTRLGGQRILFDHLVGIAAKFNRIESTQQGYVMVEATADGWWYTAPIPDGQLMVMLMTDTDLCARADLTSGANWDGRLTSASATLERVGQGTRTWGPRVFSAISQRLGRRERRTPWLAVGDAALAVDPISGSGVVRALRSARAGAETVLALLNDVTREAIAAYEADRDVECTAYLQERRLYYGMERRWRASAFWQRRAIS